MENKQKADIHRPASGCKEQERESNGKDDVWIGDCSVDWEWWVWDRDMYRIVVWTGSGECETGICTEL